MKRLNVIGKRCTLCILCLFIIFSSTACAKNEAVGNFNKLAGDVRQLQENISKQIAEGETILNNTNAKDLTDPSLLDQLRNQIVSAKNMSADIPGIASDTAEIKQQIQDLTTKKSELQKQLDSLNMAVSAIENSRQNLIAQIATENEAKIQESITPKDTYSIIATDDKGNKEKITIKIGKWIKGSDTDLLNKSWNKVGGKGTMSLPSTIAGFNFHPRTAAFVFGNVSVENMTPDFDANSFNYGNSWVLLTLDVISSDLPAVVQGRQYTSGTKWDIVGPLAAPEMDSNSWGPVPFVIGVEGVFSPNFPNGNPKLDSAHFALSSSCPSLEGPKIFQVGKTW